MSAAPVSESVMDARSAYRLLARDYDTQPNALLSLEERTMAPFLGDLEGKLVVDAAAGTGRWGRLCASRGARLIALDFCREMLEQAPGAKLQAHLERLPLTDDCSDVTICAFALGYAPESFRELDRITRRGGTLWITDVHPDAIRNGWTRSFRGGEGVVHVEHHPYSLEDLCAPGLKLTHLLEPRFGPPERVIFESQGHGARFDAAARHPAIFIAGWVKV